MPRREGCPEWDDEYWEKILEWDESEVVYEDTFGNDQKGYHKNPELAHWTLYRHDGFIGMMQYKKLEDERKARRCAALFVYLWNIGVPAKHANALADCYASKLDKIERLN